MANMPKLALHSRGMYFVKYGGKFHYLGRDLAAAQLEYGRHIIEWRKLQTAKPSKTGTTADRLIIELLTEFLDEVGSDSGPTARRHVASHTQRFGAAWGQVPVRRVVLPQVNPLAWLRALKADMVRIGYAPKTINHDLSAGKRFLEWCGAMGYLPAVSTRAIRGVPLGPRKRVDVQLDVLIGQIKRAECFDPRLGPWMRLHFLTGCRPSELVRLIHRQGVWERGGPTTILSTDAGEIIRFHDAASLQGAVFRMKSKMEKVTRDHRYLCLSPEALYWLGRCSAPWKTAAGYAQAVESTRPDPAHRVFHIRHTAATHLYSAGVSPAETAIFLGHWPPGAWLNYVREAWRTPLLLARSLRLAAAEAAWESTPRNAADLQRWQSEGQRLREQFQANPFRGRLRRFGLTYATRRPLGDPSKTPRSTAHPIPKQ
jgi:integrase